VVLCHILRESQEFKSLRNTSCLKQAQFKRVFFQVTEVS